MPVVAKADASTWLKEKTKFNSAGMCSRNELPKWQAAKKHSSKLTCAVSVGESNGEAYGLRAIAFVARKILLDAEDSRQSQN